MQIIFGPCAQEIELKCPLNETFPARKSVRRQITRHDYHTDTGTYFNGTSSSSDIYFTMIEMQIILFSKCFSISRTSKSKDLKLIRVLLDFECFNFQ